MVVVVKINQLAQPQVSGQRRGFGGHSFHQVAVAHDGVGEVIHDGVARAVEIRSEETLRHGHANAVREALAERPGGGLDARRQAVFRMPRRAAAPLAELSYVFEREIIAREVQQGVEQHRAVPGREHEAVAIGPVRISRVVLQEVCPQDICHPRRAHRHAGMPAARLFHSIHGQRSDGVDAQFIQLCRQPFWQTFLAGSGGGFRFRHFLQIAPSNRFRY